MAARKAARKAFTRREFVQSSSAAGAALISGLPGAGGAGRFLEGEEVTVQRGAVASESLEVARAGAEALERGGTAADAAAAACLAGCMAHPHLVDLGGYVACAVVLEGKTGRVWSVDANAVAPAAARERMYTVGPPSQTPPGLNENEYGCSVRDDANVSGPLAVAVPGTLGGIGMLWERWGRLKWPEVVAPAERLLEQGIPYGATANAIRLKEPTLRRYPASAEHLLPGGRVPAARDTWRRPGMEGTLRRLSSAGWRDFYNGELGRAIADHVAGLGGILTRKDMAAFEPRVAEPYATTYRGAKVAAAVLPNGGLTCLEILNLLEHFEPAADSTVAFWHRLAEVLKLAWRDRLLYLGDPSAGPVPFERFLSKDYAAGRVEALRQFPDHVDRLEPPLPNATSPGTLHVSAADAAGNLVAVTISHGGLFGSCLTVPGTGITLGHGMCRFDPHPGHPNSVGPGKRPLNNVAPLVLRLPDRDVALGLRGGRRIVSVSAQLALRVVDFAAGPAAATRAPRIHVQAKEPTEVAGSLEPRLRDRLTAMGHDLRVVNELVVGASAAEFRKRERQIRAGGNGVAAGLA